MMLGFGPLRLAPQNFWRMSPRELQAAIDGLTGGVDYSTAAPFLSKQELNALSSLFPD